MISDESLETWSELSAVRTTRAGTQVVLHIEQFDAQGRMAVEQWWTTVLLGLHGMADLGSMPNDHRFPDSARNNPIGSVTQHVDARLAHRYAEVSGDWSAHHFDIDAARDRLRLLVHPRTVHHGDLYPSPSRSRGRRGPWPGPAGGSAVCVADTCRR